MSRGKAEGRTFYSFPDAEPWEDDWFNDELPWAWLIKNTRPAAPTLFPWPERIVEVTVPLRTRAEIQREHATEGSAS